MRHRSIRNIDNAFSAAADAAYFESDGREYAAADLRHLARWEDEARGDADAADALDRRSAWQRGDY